VNTNKGTVDNPHVFFSYGGGVQSNALLVLAAAGEVPIDALYFANVGADSENPATLRYVEEIASPFAEKHGIPFREVQVTKRSGELDTLLQAIERRQGSVVIPALVEGSGISRRTCTVDFKIRLINRHIKLLVPNAYVRIGIGFSTDEWQRARDTEWHEHYSSQESASEQSSALVGTRKERFGFWRQNYYPLLEKRLSRDDCHRIITSAGLPTPPKSSCYFCPFHRRSEWIVMKQQEPELFQEACRVDELLAARHQRLQGKAVFLHPDRKPLREAVPDQAMLWTVPPVGGTAEPPTGGTGAEAEGDICDIGHCMT